MQAVSSAFTAATSAAGKTINQGALVAWSNTAITATYFTIGTSHIGGTDSIKGSGGPITKFDEYQYTNESQNVLSWSVTRKLSQNPYGVIMAQAELVLDNTSQRYTPGYDGTIGANILPGRPLKLSVGFNGEAIQQFVGYTGIPQNKITARQTVIEAYDALTYLEGIKSAQGPMINMKLDAIIISLLEEAGFGTTQFSIDASMQPTIAFFNPNGLIMTEMFKDFCLSECALMFVDEVGVIHWWNRQHLTNNATPVWALNYSNMTDVSWDSTPIMNDVVVAASPYVVEAFASLWTNSGAIALPPGATTPVFADFSNLQAVSVDAPTSSGGPSDSYYVGNAAADGSGANMTSSVSVTSTFNFGASYLTNFHNSSGSTVYLTTLELFGVPAAVEALPQQEQIDQSSITNYTLNPNNNGEIITINSSIIQDVSTEAALSYILVKQYGTPLARLICPSFAVPQMQIGDPVTVTIADTGTSYTCYVVGVTTKLEGVANLVAEYDVEQRSAFNFFTIGTSLIGGSDAIAP